MIGKGAKSQTIYVIDFGIAMRYIDQTTGNHIPFLIHKKLTGTARFATVKTHMGIEQCRRDDLETLGYVLMYLLRGNLPWQCLNASNKKERNEKIQDKKMLTLPENLCAGFPAEFATFLRYSQNLEFIETPDYDYLKTLFRNLFRRNGFKNDLIFDWMLLQSQIITQDQGIFN